MIADLQTLADEQAIRALTAAYSDAVTHLDAARAAAVYAEDGCVAIMDDVIVGRAAIETGMRRSFAAFDLLQLIAHGGLIDVAGDTAQARWSTIELTVRRGAKVMGVIFGRYQDRLVRQPAGWRFAHRTFTMAGRTQIELAKVQLNPLFGATLFGSPLFAALFSQGSSGAPDTTGETIAPVR